MSEGRHTTDRRETRTGRTDRDRQDRRQTEADRQRQADKTARQTDRQGRERKKERGRDGERERERQGVRNWSRIPALQLAYSPQTKSTAMCSTLDVLSLEGFEQKDQKRRVKLAQPFPALESWQNSYRQRDAHVLKGAR